MASLKGKVDERGRPVVWLETGSGERFLALVDTGFNGELTMTTLDARRLGFTETAENSKAVLAGDQVQTVTVYKGVVGWMGRQRPVLVLAMTPPPAQKGPSRGDSDPVGAIGTRLLEPGLLLIDYRDGSVEIAMQ
jgi:predicted aspartyl protease